MGKWENGENGKMGEWENGEMGEWGNGRMRSSSLSLQVGETK
jgi:hypothetical protein